MNINSVLVDEIIIKMGCSSCKSSPGKNENLVNRLTDYINRNDPSLIGELLKMVSYEYRSSPKDLINARLIKTHNFHLSLLCYALWIGSHKVFSYLISAHNASIEEMESIFFSYSISPISVICEKNYLEILKIYLPFYLKSLAADSQKFEQSITISFSNSPYVVESKYKYSPLQTACVEGNIGIMNYVNEFFADTKPPDSLDVNYIEEVSGENCALLSIRAGNYLMVKFLYENMNADFNLKNSRGEGALQILAVSAKNNCALQYLECTMYLIEVIRIDILYMYEETLLLLENNIIVKYFEEKLKRIGVFETKKQLEAKNKIQPQMSLISKNDYKEEKSNLVGDTQEISRINRVSCSSEFSTSFNF